MAKKGPGRAYREGLTVIELFKMFPDDEAAEVWFIEQMVTLACGISGKRLRYRDLVA